ncbi:MAG: hypothetical protein H7175_24710 [Burkholderiales bacterium]|nr:hypothetical protein [Anaerolineae bacterium]
MRTFIKQLGLIILLAIVAAACAPNAAPTAPATASLPTTMPVTIHAGTQPEIPTDGGPVTYTSAAGGYTVVYPANYTLYENEKPSVDGVAAPAENTSALYNAGSGDDSNSFVLSIRHSAPPEIEGDVSLQAIASADDPCVSDTTEGQDFEVAGQPALIFADTPCGPFGATAIYTLIGDTLYRFTVETTTNYASVQSRIEEILASFETTIA